MDNLGALLIGELEKAGFRAAIISVEHIDELENEINVLKDSGSLDRQFYDENLNWLNFNHTGIMPEAKSILVAAYPQYMTRLNFEHGGHIHPVIVPPTYVYTDVSSKAERILDHMLHQYSCSFKKTRLPVKLLAVRSGLAMYGRNNISYVNGMGSFYRLFSFYTNIPCEKTEFREKTMMPECEKCDACIRACPTKCISKDRFLIHAEKCITRFNENDGEFPEWIGSDWHNALVGCMKCQLVCQKNRELVNRTEDEVNFTQEETSMILKRLPLTQMPENLKSKLDKLDMTEYYEVLYRNLAVLIKGLSIK